jgi:hypothetical protein
MDAGLSNAALGLGAEDKGDDPWLGLADNGNENASLEGAAKPAATPSAQQIISYLRSAVDAGFARTRSSTTRVR